MGLAIIYYLTQPARKMDYEEMKKLVDGNPDTLIKKLEEVNFDFNQLPDGLSRDAVKKWCKLSDDDFAAVDFTFWAAYLIEYQASELIIEPEVSEGARKEVMEEIVSKLTFGDKISIIQNIHVRDKKNPLLRMMRKMQDLRNNVAHGKFDMLEYGGFHLSTKKGQLKMFGDIRDVYLKK
jgi:hypothetical protein